MEKLYSKGNNISIHIINVLLTTWSHSCKHFVAKLGTAGIFSERQKDNERYDRPRLRERESEKDKERQTDRERESVRKIVRERESERERETETETETE